VPAMAATCWTRTFMVANRTTYCYSPPRSKSLLLAQRPRP
jgi:hypothetical protein